MPAYFKKPSLILSFILLIFLLKGLFLTALFPIFSGQDESRHYNTIQFLLEPKEKNWDIKDYVLNPDPEERKKGYFSTYHYSQEIREVAKVIENQTIESTPYDYLLFSNSSEGKGEDEINSNGWLPYNDKHHKDIVGEQNLYHFIASYIEKFFSEESILVRFFLIRIFGVILGTLAVYFIYLIAKNIGFTEKNGLILAAIASFHPRFSIYFTNINYDIFLIPMFVLFTLGGFLAIKEGINRKNFLIMAIAVIVAVYTKATGLILLAILVSFGSFLIFQKLKRIENKEIRKKYIFIFSPLLIVMSCFLFWRGNAFLEIFNFEGFSPKEYLADSLSIGRILLTSNAYWGNLNWEDNFISINVIKLIWAIELISAIGIAIFIFSKKKINFLPEKKYIIFFLLMIIALQMGIRFADFKVFSGVGNLALGAPGRYFLPNIASHMILVFAGLGVILRRKEYFEKSLLLGLILMIAFCFYEIFNIIIPRYYL